MSKKMIIIVASLAALSALILGGAILIYLFFYFASEYECPDDVYKIVDCTEGQPIFEFDERKLNYRQRPFASIVFEELESPYSDVGKQVWAINSGPFPNKVIMVKYGKCPPGYKESLNASPLLDHRFYRVHGFSNIIHKTGPCKFELLSIQQYLDLARGVIQKEPSPPAQQK